MKVLILALALQLASFGGWAQATQPQSRASQSQTVSDAYRAAGKLLQTMHMADLLKPVLLFTIEDEVLKTKQQKRYEPVVLQFLERYINWPALQDTFASMYTRAYSEAELGELQRFYQTPLGQKFMKKMLSVLLLQRKAMNSTGKAKAAAEAQAQKELTKFTPSEQQRLQAFLRSPVGQRSTDLTPDLLEQGIALGGQKAREHMAELQQMVHEFDQQHPVGK